MRNRLRASGRPRRLFEDVNSTARSAGLLTGRRRVLDSTPLLDGVATQDTVTRLRAAIRRLLRVADRDDMELAGVGPCQVGSVTTTTPRSANRRATETARLPGMG